jgi:O-antigen ligase
MSVRQHTNREITGSDARILNYGPVLACFALAGLALTSLYLSTSLDLEPVWPIGALAAIAAAFVGMRKWPIVLVTGLIFVGTFKTTPAVGISLTDPTMIVWLLSAGAIFMELLFILGRSSTFSLQELFAGQGLGILLFLLFVIVLAGSYLYTPAPQYGIQKLFHFVGFQPLVFFAPLILLRNRKDLDHLLFAFFILGLALATKEIYGFLHPTQEVLSGNKDITHIGNGQLIGMTLLIFFYAQPFRRFPKILAVPVLGIGLVACAARGPLLSMLVVMAIYSLVARRSSGFVSSKQIIAGLAIVTVVVAGALSFAEKYPAAQAKIAEKKQELKAFAGGSSDPGGTMQERLEFYRSAASAFTVKPLLGVGLGGWTVFYYGYEKPGYPHNILLEVAAEQGVIGLTVLVGFFAAVWLAAHRIWKQQPDLAFAIPLYVYSVLVCMFSGDVNVRALWFWAGTIFAISRMCAPRMLARFHSEPVLQPA